MKIIFADDHNLIRETIGVLLQDLSKNVEVLEAVDFKGAVKQASSGTAPNLIILDLFMPGMNHLEGLRTMKEKFPSTPVVILTGSVDMADAKSALGVIQGSHRQRAVADLRSIAQERQIH